MNTKAPIVKITTSLPGMAWISINGIHITPAVLACIPAGGIEYNPDTAHEDWELLPTEYWQPIALVNTGRTYTYYRETDADGAVLATTPACGGTPYQITPNYEVLGYAPSSGIEIRASLTDELPAELQQLPALHTSIEGE